MTVGEISKLLNIPASTLRYYDKEGLLPFVERSSSGIRKFQDNDIEWLKMIECLKKSGMSIKDIKTYLELTLQGDDTIHERLELFKKQRRILQEQMASLQRTLDMLDYKCWYYETAEKAGTTDVVINIPVEALPEQYQNAKKHLSAIPENQTCPQQTTKISTTKTIM